jgi:transposase
VEDEDYQLRHERVAGIDVAKAKADVCTRLPPARDGGRRASRLEEVPAQAREILALAGRLLDDGVELVVMESTSDYWRIWFYLLEGAGLNVELVNSSHARQLAGRPKTDPLTELRREVLQVSVRVAVWLATVRGHDRRRGGAAGSVAAGGAAIGGA